MSRVPKPAPLTQDDARDAANVADANLRATVFTCGPDTFAVLSFPKHAAVLPEDLTASEKEICRMLLSGASNAEIAECRGTAPRTIANQVASILRKLGAGSRSELPAVLARRAR